MAGAARLWESDDPLRQPASSAAELLTSPTFRAAGARPSGMRAAC
jgi:hypothetical protein